MLKQFAWYRLFRMGIKGREPFFRSVGPPQFHWAGGLETASAVVGPDFEQITELLHQRAVGLKDGGLAVPYVGCFTAGAVDFDNLEAAAFLKFPVIRESHIESAKIGFLELWILILCVSGFTGVEV